MLAQAIDSRPVGYLSPGLLFGRPLLCLKCNKLIHENGKKKANNHHPLFLFPEFGIAKKAKWIWIMK